MTDYSLTLNAEDLERIRIDKEKFEREATLLKNDIREIMNMAVGRRIIDWIMRISSPFKDNFSENPIAMAHNIGRSHVGIQLHNLLQSQCPDRYQIMMNEFRSRTTKEKGKKS
jgi:hypothetical protein